MMLTSCALIYTTTHDINKDIIGTYQVVNTDETLPIKNLMVLKFNADYSITGYWNVSINELIDVLGYNFIEAGFLVTDIKIIGEWVVLSDTKCLINLYCEFISLNMPNMVLPVSGSMYGELVYNTNGTVSALKIMIDDVEASRWERIY